MTGFRKLAGAGLLLAGLCALPGCGPRPQPDGATGANTIRRPGLAPKAPPNRAPAPAANTAAADAARKLGMTAYPGDPKAPQKGQTAPSVGGVAEMTTVDSFDKVAAFYLKEYPKAATRQWADKGCKVMEIAVSQPPDMKKITISEQRPFGAKVKFQRTRSDRRAK